MSELQVRRTTAIMGIAVGVGSILLIPLYFTYSGAPPTSNVLTRNLINMILCACLLVFYGGVSHLIRKADATHEWTASIVYGSALVYVAVVLVGISLEVGAAFSGPSGTIDPTIDGPLALGTILIHGSIGRVLTVVLMTALGSAIRGTRILSRWLGTSAYGLAIINLAFVPSLYFGRDAARFYSALGWGNSAMVASFMGYWVMAAGVVMLRQSRASSVTPRG